jgi:predicted transcriptional regulator
MPTRDLKQFVRISPELAHRLRIIAAVEQRPAYDLLEQIVREWLDRRNQAALENSSQDDTGRSSTHRRKGTTRP